MTHLIFLFIVFFLSGCANNRPHALAPFSYGTGSSAHSQTQKAVIVAPGETLGSIALNHHVSAQDLIRLNQIPAPYSVRVGQRLILPHVRILATLTPPPRHNAATPPSHPEPTLEPTLAPFTTNPQDPFFHKPKPAPIPSPLPPKPEPTLAAEGKNEWKDIPLENASSESPLDASAKNTIKKPEVTAEQKTLPSPLNEELQHDATEELLTLRKKKTLTKKKNSLSPSPKKEDPLPEEESSSFSQKDPRDSSLALKNKAPQASPSPKEDPETPSSQHEGQQEKEEAPPSSDIATGFSWPLTQKGEVIMSFNQVVSGAKNDGINIAAPKGTPIVAIADGEVAYSGNELKGFGNIIFIKHKDNWASAYAHADKLLLKTGQKVKKGQQIGTIGQTGYVNKPQLHFELRKNGEAMDPTKHLK